MSLSGTDGMKNNERMILSVVDWKITFLKRKKRQIGNKSLLILGEGRGKSEGRGPGLTDKNGKRKIPSI